MVEHLELVQHCIPRGPFTTVPTCALSLLYMHSLSALVQAVLYVIATAEDVATNSYDEICNLRRQTEKLAAQDQLYKRKDSSWCVPFICQTLPVDDPYIALTPILQD